MNARALLFTVLFGVALLVPGAANAQFSIDWYTIDGGGGTSTGGPFSLMGTIGQHDAGSAMIGGALSISGGFWGAGIGPGPCPADFNGDGQVDFFDYLDFVAAFAEEDPSADFNGDGQVDFFDYLDFVAAFAEGCD